VTRVEDGQLLSVMVLHPDPVVSAGDVAIHVDIDRPAVNKRLNRLSDRGLVKSKRVGSSAKIYWPTPDGREAAAEYSL